MFGEVEEWYFQKGTENKLMCGVRLRDVKNEDVSFFE
jgi:hypothetical protein